MQSHSEVLELKIPTHEFEEVGWGLKLVHNSESKRTQHVMDISGDMVT